MDDPLENFIMPEINLDDFEAYEIHRGEAPESTATTRK
jgi:hypothetical protein